MGSILGPKINKKTSRILSAILGRLLGGPGAPQWPKTMIFIKKCANFRRSPLSPRDRFFIDFGAILATFWGHFADVFLLFFQGVFRRALWEQKKPMIHPTGAILGARGGERGGVNPSPEQKCCKNFVLFFVAVFFAAWLRQPVLDARPRAGGFRFMNGRSCFLR